VLEFGPRVRRGVDGVLATVAVLLGEFVEHPAFTVFVTTSLILAWALELQFTIYFFGMLNLTGLASYSQEATNRVFPSFSRLVASFS
jgi:hypothetical protein